MIYDAEAVVVGAGAIGASIGFHLAKAGRRVVLVDKHEVASQTSLRAAGLTSQVRSTDLMTRLAIRAVRKIESFEAETGEKLTYEQSGSLKIARTQEHEEQLRQELARGRRHGLNIDLISPSEARRLNPFLVPKGIRSITYVASDLYLDPAQLPQGYARAARKLGAIVLPNTAVIGIITSNGAVERVITTRGHIRTPLVVDAAGAWTQLVAEMANGRALVVPTRHQLLITDPIAGIAPNLPIVRVIDSNVYIRPEKGGLLLGGYEPNPVQYGIKDLPSGFQIQDLPLNLDVLRRLADTVVVQFPVLREFTVREHRGGLPTMTADGKPLIGSIPSVRGFFIASGCCVGGLSISPAVGEVVSEWIMSGTPPMDLTPLSPERFGPEYYFEERLRAECRKRYAFHYSNM